MIIQKEAKSFNVRIITNPKEILRYLQIGINIPILPKFQKYVIRDIKNYRATAIILEEDISTDLFTEEEIDKVVGTSLIYTDNGDILFFGFFGVYDHDPEKIDFLIEVILNYAKESNFKYIRGPINIPTCIFGWGFMEKGSCKELFITLPVNPPMYQERFVKKGFYVKFRELHYHGTAWKLNPRKLKDYDFSDYEYMNPGKEGMLHLKNKFIKFHKMYLPLDSRITPNISGNAENLFDFIFENGEPWMIWVVYYKPTREIAAFGYCIPNPFSLDKKGRLDSVNFHSWIVHPIHRKKGLTKFMYGETSLRAMPPKGSIRKGGGPVGSKNIANRSASLNLGFNYNRSHVILEYNF